MYCVNCGKEKVIFQDGLCIECYVKDNILTEGPDIINIIKCAHCGAYRYKNNWINEDFKEVFKRKILNKFKIRKELENINIITDCGIETGEIECNIIITGFLGNVNIKDKHKLKIRIKTLVCDVCSKRYGGYHEAIIQIRVEQRKLSNEEIQDFIKQVESQVESLYQKGNRSLFITDIGIQSRGIDFYISDKGAAFGITKKLQEKNGGIIKQSSKNIGMKDSRQVYRMTYLLRLPTFKKGDFIRVDKRYYIVKSFSSEKVKLIDLSNWSLTIYEIKYLENVKVLGGKDLVREAIVVSQTKNEVQLMDKINYQTFYLKKPYDLFLSSKKIKFVKMEDEIFLFLENYINHKY